MPVPIAGTALPRGVVWLTPVNDIEVAVTASALGAVTTTLWAPLGGATRYQISLRTVPFVEAPAKVMRGAVVGHAGGGAAGGGAAGGGA